MTFEEFLKDWHMKAYQGTDDDAPDAFEHWLGNQEIEFLMRLATLYGKEMYIRGMKHVEEIINKSDL